jgi:hypothetical protein
MNGTFNPMRYLTIVLLFWLVSLQSNAQTCKFAHDKSDPITGVRTIAQPIKLNPAVTIALGQTGVQKEFAIAVVAMGGSGNIMPAGSTAIFKLSNGDTLQYHSKSDAEPTQFASTHSSQYSATTQLKTMYTLVFEVDERLYSTLSNRNVEVIRVLYKDQDLQTTVEVKSSTGKKIMKYASCLR